ncbi:MAG: glycosyltransferase family 4 protein [Pedobacter sp.]|nr:glycosyltransferase family 4 protein [Chitinophagaceae bacterium]
MKYQHSGLYHFCWHLGNSLAKEIDIAKEALHFYVPPFAKGIFGTNVFYEKQHDLHKLLYPKTSYFNVWHCVYQNSDYFPSNKKIKKVLTIHDLNFIYDCNKNDTRKKKYLNDLQKKVNNSHHITTISQFVLDDVKQYINLNDKPTSVIYNGCNITKSSNLQAPNYQPQHPFLFTIGTVIDKKNFHVLPCLLADNNMYLIISGIIKSDTYKQKIIAEATKYNVADRVIFTGPISENDKQWYYQNCEAFVFPSLAEGFGLPVIEAMYFGKPAILSTHTSLPEIGGEAAYYFNSFSPEDMVQTLVKSLHHYQTTNPSNAIKQRAALFSWQTAAQQYLAVYRSLY